MRSKAAHVTTPCPPAALRMSQGGAEAGHAALAAWRDGGDFRAWERALKDQPDRVALAAARRHNLFPAAGMR